jgi:iron complex outermembrane recepter protein
VPIRFNISAYDLEYSGIQRANGDNVANGCTPGGGGPGRCLDTGNTTGLDQGAITYNAGSARVRGIELETTARLFPGFELSGSYSYTDAKYTKYFLNIPADPVSGPSVGVKQTCDGPVAIPTSGTGVLVNLTCSPFPFTPKNQFSIGARYAFKIGNAGEIVLNGTLSHADKAWTAPASLPSQAPSGYIDSYNVVNASIDWNSVMGSHIDARFFVTNLTNETYRISNSNGDDTSLGYSASIYSEPRMYGVSIRYRFGE